MFNFRKLVDNIKDFLLNPAKKDPKQIKPVGAGYWGHTVDSQGRTKLVKRDQSREIPKFGRKYIKPQQGMRRPERRMGRRLDILFDRMNYNQEVAA